MKINVGLGWNDFKITIHNKNQEIRPVIYLFRIERVPRSENPDPFKSTNDNITVCILEQVIELIFLGGGLSYILVCLIVNRNVVLSLKTS